MVDEMPTFDGTEPANLKDLLNGMSSAVDDRMAQLAEEVRTAQAVPTVAALPATGNWVGRVTFVQEDGTLRIVSSLPNGWITVYRVPVDGTIAFHPGWSADPSLNLSRDANEVTLNFNGDKTSAIVSKEIVGFMPVGFRPSALTYYPATVYGVGDPIPATVSITETGEIKVWFGGTTTERELSFLATFRI